MRDAQTRRKHLFRKIRASSRETSASSAKPTCVATRKRGIIPGGSPSRARNRGIMSRRSYEIPPRRGWCRLRHASLMRGNRESAACVTYLVGYRYAPRPRDRMHKTHLASLWQESANLKGKRGRGLTNRFSASVNVQPLNHLRQKTILANIF